MEEAKKSRFVEIRPSGFPKMRAKNKFEKGGTGVENGWGREMAHTQAHKKNQNFFSKFFLWRLSLSTTFLFVGWSIELQLIWGVFITHTNFWKPHKMASLTKSEGEEPSCEASRKFCVQ